MKKTKDLRIVFIGTPDFAVESLKRIYESGRNIVAVITAPDKKSGRGQQLQESAVKKYATEQNIPVLQPTNLKDESFLSQLRSYHATIQVVVAFRMLPEVVWDMPELGTFNLHASLLPNYRGAAPINWAIINGEKETGVTTFFLKHEIDTGDLLIQEKVIIEDNETAGSLHDKLMTIGGELVLKSLALIESSNYQLINQEELMSETPKHAPKIFKDNCRVDWNQSAQKIGQFIRGLSPYPGAWTQLIDKDKEEVKQLKIFNCSIYEAELDLKIGEIKIENNQVFIGTSSGIIEITELQLEGKKKMKPKALLNGFNLLQYDIKS